MEPIHTSMFGSARRAASLVRDLVDVVREVNEWRHERDAFVAMYLDEMRRREAGDEMRRHEAGDTRRETEEAPRPWRRA